MKKKMCMIKIPHDSEEEPCINCHTEYKNNELGTCKTRIIFL